MGVASKTKRKIYTTVVLGFVAALSAWPTWASTIPGITSITTVKSDVVSTQSKSDLSVLRSKLKDRFSWVAREAASLINWTTSPAGSFHGLAAVRTIDVSQWIWVQPANASQDFFVDTLNDPYKIYINRLAAYGVLSSSQKFYPQNYFRVNDFMKLLDTLYQKRFGQSLSQDVLWITAPDGVMTKWILQQIMFLLKGIQVVNLDGNPSDKLMRSEWAYYLVRIFDLPALAANDQAAIPAGNAFTDITGHPFASAITTLASLGILNTQTAKFYPDNYLRHYDFTIIFVNALLASKNQSLSLDSSVSPFADVETNASYLPQLKYAADHWLIDPILTSKAGQLSFDPNGFMTKQQVYQILGKALDIQVVYDEAKAGSERISRAELAKLLVESFQFQPKNMQSAASSWTLFATGDLTLVTKLKTLLSMM